MNEYLKYAEEFRDLKISLKALKNSVPASLFKQCENKTAVCAKDVINLLYKYKEGKISAAELLEWVNTVWFSELFYYDEYSCDSVASIINELEEADERDDVLSDYNIERYLTALKNNAELN